MTTHPPCDDQDLSHDLSADASTDADALDAWLNEIVSTSGTPDARSGTDRPEARSDDAASVIAAAARFHERIERAQTRDPRATAPDPRLWETIMARTSSSTAPMPGARPRPAAPRGHIHNADLRRRRSAQRRPGWQTLANIALVATLLIVGVGLWRLAGGPGLPGGGDGSRPAPHYAMQPGTPAAAVASTPVDNPPSARIAATVAPPAPMTACDLRGDIPIFPDVDESPWGGTAVLLTTTGDLVLACPEEPEPAVLASGVASVTPLEWPGVVGISLAAERPEEEQPGVVSLFTGDVLTFSQPSESDQIATRHLAGSPWLVGAAPDDPAHIQIVDLRTMEMRALAEIAGAALPSHGGYLLSASADGGTLALGLSRQAHPAAGEATLVTSGLPGDLLVLDGSLDAPRWITAPDGFAPVVGMSVSPDGEHIALHGARGTMQEREHAWSIVRLADGAEVARTAPVTAGPEPREAVWTDAGLAFIADDALMMLPAEEGATAAAVFKADGPLAALRATADPSIVLVDQQWGDDLATMVASERVPMFHAVDVTTGEATTFTGVDISHNTDPWPYPERFLVTFEYAMDLGDSITYHAHDAVTGEMIDSLDDVPVTDPHNTGYPMLGPRAVVSSADGGTEVIAFDTQHIYLIQMMDGEARVRQIASPEGLPGDYPMLAYLFLSANGTLLSLTADGDESGTRWLLPLDGELDAWIEVPKTATSVDPAYILFVPGTSD